MTLDDLLHDWRRCFDLGCSICRELYGQEGWMMNEQTKEPWWRAWPGDVRP